MPGELKSPPTWKLEVGGTSTLQPQLPARLKSPTLQTQVWGGSRWADLAVKVLYVMQDFLGTGINTPLSAQSAPSVHPPYMIPGLTISERS